MAGLARGQSPEAIELTFPWVNGQPALCVDVGDDRSVLVLDGDEMGRIERIYVVRNPDKLARTTTPRAWR